MASTGSKNNFLSNPPSDNQVLPWDHWMLLRNWLFPANVGSNLVGREEGSRQGRNGSQFIITTGQAVRSYDSDRYIQ